MRCTLPCIPCPLLPSDAINSYLSCISNSKRLIFPCAVISLPSSQLSNRMRWRKQNLLKSLKKVDRRRRTFTG